MCDAQIDDLFGSPTIMPLDVEDLFVHGVAGPRKWLVIARINDGKSVWN